MCASNKRFYIIPVLSKALDVLEILEAENQPLTLDLEIGTQ